MNVHIDVFSAETGVSRFLELNKNSGWLYDKTENLKPIDKLKFSHLLIEADSEDDKRLDAFKKTHIIQHFVKGFDGIYYLPTGNSPLPLPRIRKAPKIFILKKNVNKNS